jgi:gluconate 5-dehydrogenase
VTDIRAVQSGVATIEGEIGPIDILVNNAGIQRRAPLETYEAETWSEIMRANVDSVFFVGQAVARHMIPRGRGKIINIASLQAQAARYSIAPYTATKGAVLNLTKGMCTDWARHGLQINAIGPGYFETPLNQALVDDPKFTDWLKTRTPTGRWGRVEELQGAAIFLASAASDFVNGQIVYVDGGVLATL